MKSYKILKLTVSEFLGILQKRTSENANKMKEIFDYTTEIKRTEPDSEERKIKLKNALILNNEFIKINKKYIDLHNNVLDIINELATNDDEDYNDEQEKIVSDTPNLVNATNTQQEEDINKGKEKSINNNEVELERNNPLFKNKDYTDKLMKQYIEEEEYEKCNLLQKFLSENKL